MNPQRQSSYGPINSSQNSNHFKQSSRDFQKSSINMNNQISSKRSSNSAMGMAGTSASKSTSNLAQQIGSSNLNVNTSNMRSNSRTSVSGHSASNISNGGSTSHETSGNIVSSKISEQQGIINKYIEKEKRYADKIK